MNVEKTIFESTDPELRGIRSRSKGGFSRSKHGHYGQGNHFAKLEEGDVQAIRKAIRYKRETREGVAGAYGISVRTVDHIISRRTWRHVR